MPANGRSNLIENKAPGGIVARFQGASALDYLIQVFDETNALDELMQQLRQVKGVNYTQELDPAEVRSYRALGSDGFGQTERTSWLKKRKKEMKRTKIVATMGPASNSEEQLEKLIQEGMNVARLNFSHGEHAVHGETIQRLRRIDEKLGTYTAILADLQGPKLRIGDIEGGSIELVKGSELRIRTGTEMGVNGCVYTNYTQFAKDVKPGEPVLMDDGKLELRVIENRPHIGSKVRGYSRRDIEASKGNKFTINRDFTPLYHGKGRRRFGVRFRARRGLDWVVFCQKFGRHHRAEEEHPASRKTLPNCSEN